ncbi:hypothetical protein D3C86_1643060 [compost metagenome]
MAKAQRGRHVRLLHETEVQQDAVEILAEVVHLEAPILGHAREVLGDHGEQHHLGVQHLVVQQVLQQGVRYGIRTCGEEHRRALDPVRGLAADAVDEQWQRQAVLIQTLEQHLLAASPGGHQHEQDHGDQQREDASLENLRHVGGEEQQVDAEKT